MCVFLFVLAFVRSYALEKNLNKNDSPTWQQLLQNAPRNCFQSIFWMLHGTSNLWFYRLETIDLMETDQKVRTSNFFSLNQICTKRQDDGNDDICVTIKKVRGLGSTALKFSSWRSGSKCCQVSASFGNGKVILLKRTLETYNWSVDWKHILCGLSGFCTYSACQNVGIVP